MAFYGMTFVPLERRFSHVLELANAKPRGSGFGVKGSAHTVFWPSYDSYDLGLLTGMIYGDGNLIARPAALKTGKWRIEMCEGDLGIVRTYARLTRDLFNVKPTIRNRVTWHEAYYSRIVYEFLTHVGEHPNGKKTGRLRIPEIAKRNPDTLRGFVAGIFSVESSVWSSSKERLRIEMLEPTLVRELYLWLHRSGFQPHRYEYAKDSKMMQGVYLYGQEDCRKFLSGIGLVGKKRKELTRFLRSRTQASPARK
jgi:hypothetical protein